MSEGAGWHAILLAGQRPGIDPLACHFGEELKALVPVAGRPMLAHCLETLLAVPEIVQVHILAQEPERLMAHPQLQPFADDPRLSLVRSGAGIAASVRNFAEERPCWPILVTTADHVLLRPETVADFLHRASGHDVAVGVVERRTVLTAYPDNRRTWLHFGGGSWTGANLFALNGPGALKALELWAGVEAHRKKGWRLLARFGAVLLLRALTRTIRLDAAMGRAARRLGFTAAPIALGDALAAIDVDKPSDHALAEAVLGSRI